MIICFVSLLVRVWRAWVGASRCGKLAANRLYLISILIFLLAIHPAAAHTPTANDSTKVAPTMPVPPPHIRVTRVFPNITPAEKALPYDPIVPREIADDSLLQKRARAHSLREEVEKMQRFKETLDATSIIDLPMGVLKSGNFLDYSIIVDKVIFNPQGAKLDAYMSFTIPQTGHRIAFGGTIPLSKEGGIVGTAKIYLLGDHEMELSSNSLLTIMGSKDKGTFVELDCNGFKGMSINGKVEFSRDVLIPDSVDSPKTANERVAITFQTYVSDWNELLVKVNVPNFQVTRLKDVGFSIEEAYLDWSDLTNPTGLVFPPNYESAYTTSGNKNLWRGFYMRKAAVRLSRKFKETNPKKSVYIGVENLIIDDMGFSGKIFAENLIQAGDMNGWRFTLDRLSVGVAANQVQEFDMAGMLTVPAFKKEGNDSQMGYRASQSATGDYIFAVTLLDEVNLPLWAANVSLYKGSSVIVRERENKFYPTATLNGMLSIKALNKGPKAEIAGVRFENLVLSTEAPYFRPGTFGVGSAEREAKASGFPMVIRNIGIKSNAVEHKVGLSMDVTINISGQAEDEGFSGTAGLIVWGDMNAPVPPSANVETGVVHGVAGGWEFDRVELTAVGISIKKPGVYELAGQIRFYDGDPVYGDGFNGQVNGKFKDRINVQANVIFGRTPTYRYWFADALVVINGGVVLAPGLAAYSFGGGFYSKMKQSAASSGSPLGQTASGITYQPDENTTGLKAYLNFGGTPRKEAFNGDVTFEIAMNRHGGINRVSFIGNAYFLTPGIKIDVEQVREGAREVAVKANKVLDLISPRSQVYGSVKLIFDNENDVFHGDIEVYVNVVGGIVRGIGERNRAGYAVLHFAASEWYVLIGTPDNPIGLEVARIFKSRGYFMMGKNLPGSPPPPAKVSEILGGLDLDYMRDINQLESGLGMAFGMGFSVNTGDIRFLLFYGRFEAGTGFDIMLKNYGTSYHCEGDDEPLGINGWYANGQAYAYIAGKIGIRVKLMFIRGDFDILAIGAAAVMQVKGPNPFWMKGTVGGYYRILGGMVKGRCRFEVTVGKECKPVGESNPLENVAIIADMTPVTGSSEVDVFVAPQAAFNLPVGEVFELTDMDNTKKLFKAELVEFSIKDGSSVVPGKLQWNSTNDVVILNTHDILPPKKEIKAFVKVVFKQKNGTDWAPVLFDGKAVEETQEIAFTTGEAPDYIPPSNVEVSYPLIGQYNFYPAEYSGGFIQLKKGQPYLFENDPKWIRKARMTVQGDAQRYKEFDMTYDVGARRVGFTIPSDLPLATIHKFELLNIPRQSQLIDANVERVSKELVEGEAGVAELTTKKVEGQVEVLTIKSMYESELRTSAYRTFVEKMNSIKLSTTFRISPTLNIFQLVSNLEGNEFFDFAELSDGQGYEKLIEIEAIMDNNEWYNNYVYPLVYEGYPLLGIAKIRYRLNPEKIGIPPFKDIFFTQQNEAIQVASGYSSTSPESAFAAGVIRYNLMHPMYTDYTDIQNSVVNKVVTNPDVLTPRLSKIILQTFPWIRYGSYEFYLRYRIPGSKNVSSSITWKLFNKIPDNE